MANPTTALPETFGRFQARRFDMTGDDSGDRQVKMSRAKPSRVRSGVFAVQEFDPLAKWSDLVTKARVAGMQAFPMFAQWAGGTGSSREAVTEEGAPEQPAPTADAAYARNADYAEDRYASRGYSVERRPMTEMHGRDVVGMLKATWRPPRPDEKVVLYEEEGVVKGMTVVPLEETVQPGGPQVRGPEDETLVQPVVRKEELTVLKERLKEMERKHEALLEAVAPEKIEALESQVRKLQDLGIITPEGEPGPGRITRRPTKPEE